MPFRGTSGVHPLHPCVGEPIPMRKPPTGEPCAGELHARFGGRGRREPFPTLSILTLISGKSEAHCKDRHLYSSFSSSLFSSLSRNRISTNCSGLADLAAGTVRAKSSIAFCIPPMLILG